MSLTGAVESVGGLRLPKVTVASLRERKRAGDRITAMTAYDYPAAKLVDEAGIDLVLVGDSLAMAVLGHPDTLSVTMDEMLHHVKAVRRGLRSSLLVADMPYGSYHLGAEQAVSNALRMVKEGGAEAVKVEGGLNRVAVVRAITDAEVPVIGHIGLTPQSVNAMGGYKVQGRSADAVDGLLRSALALEDAGAVALVLEGIPREVAAMVTAKLAIPTIGIGAGPDCDGQILVFHDVFALTFTAKTKFARRFGDAAEVFRAGLAEYREAVAAGTFPSDEESYHLPAAVREELGLKAAEGAVKAGAQKPRAVKAGA